MHSGIWSTVLLPTVYCLFFFLVFFSKLSVPTIICSCTKARQEVYLAVTGSICQGTEYFLFKQSTTSRCLNIQFSSLIKYFARLTGKLSSWLHAQHRVCFLIVVSAVRGLFFFNIFLFRGSLFPCAFCNSSLSLVPNEIHMQVDQMAVSHGYMGFTAHTGLRSIQKALIRNYK